MENLGEGGCASRILRRWSRVGATVHAVSKRKYGRARAVIAARIGYGKPGYRNPSNTEGTLGTNPAKRAEPDPTSLGKPAAKRGRARFVPKSDT